MSLTRRLRWVTLLPLPLALIATSRGLSAADSAPGDDLKARLDGLEQEIKTLKATIQQEHAQTQALSNSVTKSAAERDVDNSFNFGGYGLFGYDYSHEEGHQLTAQFQPIFSYGYRDDFLFVGELNFQTDSSPELTQAYMAYTKLSHVIIEVGKFPLPFAAYSERLSPAWINKFANAAPANYGDAFGVFQGDQTDVGAQIRGDIPFANNMRVNYDLFVVAGPNYNATDGSDDRLSFGNNTAYNHVPPTVGGRLAIQPSPSHEIGVSAMTGHINNNVAPYQAPTDTMADLGTGLVTPGVVKSGNLINQTAVYDTTDNRSFVAYALDMDYHNGGFAVRGELTKVDADNSANERMRTQGGYLQLSQRLTFLNGYVRNFEPVIRGGAVTRNLPLVMLDSDGQPKYIQDVTEIDIGVNYYFTNYIRSSVFVLGHNDHSLDQASFVTTFAF